MKKTISTRIALVVIAAVVGVSFAVNGLYAQTSNGSSLDRILELYLQIKLGAQDSISQMGENLGAAGSLLAEQYIPYVTYNTGYNSAYAITTTDTVTAGTLAVTGNTTFTGTLAVTGASTLTGALTVNNTADVGALTQGGGRTASSTTAAAGTLVAGDFDTENVYVWTLNESSGTLTTPASSTLSSFIPNTGDMRTLWFENATSTAGTLMTLAAGTGWNFHYASSTATAVVNSGDVIKVDALRRSDTDIDAFILPFND